LLSHKQELFIALYATSPDLEKVYKLCDISKQTFYNWKRNSPDFKEQLEKTQRATIDGITERLNDLAIKAIETLETMLNNPNPSIKMRSAQLILENLWKYKTINLEERLQEIERAIESKGDK
jgi:hypothetical protein